MTIFFPEPKTSHVAQVELTAFQCGDTVVQLAAVAPHAEFPLHHHPDCPMGMLLTGELDMTVGGTTERLIPFESLYAAGSDVSHGSQNPLAETVQCFDVKRLVPLNSGGGTVASPIYGGHAFKDQETGLSGMHFSGEWFEVIVTEIPPGEKLPPRRSPHAHMGIVCTGQLTMEVETQEQTLEYGRIYYAPPQMLHTGYNDGGETVKLVEIQISGKSEWI